MLISFQLNMSVNQIAVEAIVKKWANLRTYYLRELTKWEKLKNTSDGSHEVCTHLI